MSWLKSILVFGKTNSHKSNITTNKILPPKVPGTQDTYHLCPVCKHYDPQENQCLLKKIKFGPKHYVVACANFEPKDSNVCVKFYLNGELYDFCK